MATTEQEQMIFWAKESHSNVTQIISKLDAIGKGLIDEKYTYAKLSQLLPDLETINTMLDQYVK